MAEIWEVYTDEVYKHLKPLYATWEPGMTLKLGYFGVMEDHMFMHRGNIFDIIRGTGESVDLEVVKDEKKDHRTFSSQATSEFLVYAQGEADVTGVVQAKAGIDIGFSSDRGVFFNAAECVYDMFADKIKLEKIILKLLEGRHWRKDWVIVTDIVRAGATTVVISSGKKSSIKLEVGADVPKINLADASLKLGISRQEKIGYTVVSAEGMFPLIGLAQLDKREELASPKVAGEEGPEPLYLRQLE